MFIHDIPSNPALSNILTGYQTIGMFPTGSSALGHLDVKSVILDPSPAAIITGINSILASVIFIHLLKKVDYKFLRNYSEGPFSNEHCFEEFQVPSSD